MNHNGKRLRDVDYPRITFHAPERTFDRLFKESSLYDLKQTVIKKLGLPSDSSIYLAQIRGGQSVDLDDDDDFDAFYTVAHSQWSVDVDIRLAETRNLHSTDEDVRPRKKHRGSHDSPSMSDNEAGVRAAGATGNKKRKVVFAESSTEGVLSEKPRRKKKKSESDGAANNTEVVPSSSHDTTKKKKSKKDASVEGNYDVPEQSGTVERDPDIPVDEPVQPGPSGPSNAQQQSKATSSSSRRTSSLKAKVPSAPDQTLEDQSHTPTPMASAKATGKRSTQSSTSTARRDSARENSKSVSEEKDDHSAERSTPSENSQDMSSLEDEVTQNTMLSSRSEQSSKSVSLDAEEENQADAGVVSAGKPTEAQMKDIVTNLVAAKRKLLAATSVPVTILEDSSSSSRIPAQSAELPERTSNSAKSSKVASKPICLACTKAPKHDLADCPVVQEGPVAIQKRIKALRATKKYSDKEKTPVIEGLKQAKQDLRVQAKQSTKESKVNAQSHSHSSSGPQDAEVNDVSSDRINDVAGVSSQARPITQLSNKGSSGTSSTDTPPGAAVQLSAEKRADGDGSLNSFIPSHNEDLSAVDLQELIRGPKDALVSVNDLPSSDENDDDERMSGGPEEDEVGKDYRRLTSFGNDSSEGEDSDAERDNGDPTGSFAHTEQHVSVTESQDAIPEPGLPTVAQEQSIPRPSIQGDVPSDEDDAVNANGRDAVLQEEESVVGTKFPVNGQPAGTSFTDPVVSQATEATLDASSASAEEPDLSVMRVPSDASESIQSAQSSPRQVNDSPAIEQISDDMRVGPVRRSNRRTKPSVVTEDTTTEQDSGKRKRAATKKLSQVSNDILNSVTRTIRSKIRATSVPADEQEQEPRTPGRKRVRVATKIERALNNKGKDTSTSKSRKKKDVPVTSENDPSIMLLQDQTSLRSATPSVPEWTTLTPVEDDNGIIRDEPASSSPLLRKSNANKKGVKKIAKQTVERANENLPNTPDDDPLFAPSTSQLPYPYSQKLHVEKRRENARNDSEEEQEVTSSLTPNGRTPHKYRRLSDIGPKPFMKRLSTNLVQHHSSKIDRVNELYGRRGKHGDDGSDSDSDSDSEPKKISHIPKTRMAGA